MSVKVLLEELSTAEIYEWMAFDLYKNPEFSKKIDSELEQERQKNMSPEEHAKMVLSMFKNKGK